MSGSFEQKPWIIPISIFGPRVCRHGDRCLSSLPAATRSSVSRQPLQGRRSQLRKKSHRRTADHRAHAEANASGRLHATISAENRRSQQPDFPLFASELPVCATEKLDLGNLEPVCRDIGHILRKKNSFHLVVLRSTALTRHHGNHRHSGPGKSQRQTRRHRHRCLRQSRIYARRHRRLRFSGALYDRHRRCRPNLTAPCSVDLYAWVPGPYLRNLLFAKRK